MRFKVSRRGWLPGLPDHRDRFCAAPTVKTGHVSLPKSSEQAFDGHAVIGGGYDNAKQWFIVRNSWGGKRGMAGYFILPMLVWAVKIPPVISGQSASFND
jgi:hypothetical protein